MYWTLELASKLEDAPWPATKEELLDYATRSGAPLEVLENLCSFMKKNERKTCSYNIFYYFCSQIHKTLNN